jgi:hypothetical protein
MDTWKPGAECDLPVDSRVIPGAWIQEWRFPDGRLNKFKACFCVRGDSSWKRESITMTPYSPVVGWAHRSSWTCDDCLPWSEDQTGRDFTNAFSKLNKRTHCLLSYSHYQIKGMEHLDIVLSLQKSLYGHHFPNNSMNISKLAWKTRFCCESESCLFIHI